MRSLDRNALAQRLAVDGMVLPNGHARDVSEEAWERLLDRLTHGEWPTVWPEAAGRRPQRTEDLADDAFAVARIQVASAVLINLFPSWGTDGVWFDFDAREMRRQCDADALSQFVRVLGQTVRRPVELSYEGSEKVFVIYEPDADEFWWTDVP